MEEQTNILNKEQKRAVEHYKGPCMVLAGPGTGKTTIIINRVMHLLTYYNISPENILIVTFTKAAANEMKERFMKFDGYKDKYKKVNFGTFHSIFFKILQEYNKYRIDNLLVEKEKRRIIKVIAEDLGISYFEEEQNFEDLISQLSYVKYMLICNKEYKPNTYFSKNFWEIHNQYETYKKINKKFDFDDMINHCYELLQSERHILDEIRKKYQYILIDEFQDINKSQYEIINLIAHPLNNLFVVGDDDQTIYGFRGSDPNAMHKFSNRYANTKLISLKYNYRNSKAILDIAKLIIRNNKKRYNKDLVSIKSSEKTPCIVKVEDFEMEAKSIANKIKILTDKKVSYSDIAVLYRTRIQSALIIENFVNEGIPFVCYDGISYTHNHWIYKDIISYLKASQNIERNKHIIKIINKPYRYIGRNLILDKYDDNSDILNDLILSNKINKQQKSNLMNLKKSLLRIKSMKVNDAIFFIKKTIGYENYIIRYAKERKLNIKPLIEILNETSTSMSKAINILEYLDNIEPILNKSIGKDNKEESIKVMTMHKAKGLEYKIVFLTGIIEGLLPSFNGNHINSCELEEERRLFYVAMTRAANELYFYTPKYRYGKRAKQSRFLNEIYKLS